MPLNAEQVARLYAAGSVPIPSFPNAGQLSADVNAFMLAGAPGPEATLEIVHYASPAHKHTFIVPLKAITAVFLPDGLAPGNGPQWLLGEELRGGHGNLNQLVGGSRPGTVFAREDAGVLMRVESVLTAAEVAAIPGCCL